MRDRSTLTGNISIKLTLPTNRPNNQAGGYNDWEGVDSNGGVVNGTVDDKNCTYVSIAGMTIKDCD